MGYNRNQILATFIETQEILNSMMMTENMNRGQVFLN